MARPQPALAVGEGPLKLDSAGGLVNLIVQEAELTDSQRLRAMGHTSADRELFPADGLLNFLQILLGNCEGDVNGFDLVDGHQNRNIVGFDHVAGLHH